MVCHHCENWLGDLRRSDHSIAGRAVMTRRTQSSIIRQSLLFDFWLSPSWLYNLLGDDISKWNTFIFVPDMLQPCPSSEMENNLIGIFLMSRFQFAQYCTRAAFVSASSQLLGTLAMILPLLTLLSSRRQQKKELRRRSKSRSYTLLCFAKSLRQ